MTTRFQKQIVEATNLAHERGHIKITVSVAGRSHTRRGQYAVLTCDRCSTCSTVREKPYPDESDLEGTLHKQNCNVATHPSGLTGEHDVVLDAINEESFHASNH